jgi:hypothetical protein
MQPAPHDPLRPCGTDSECSADRFCFQHTCRLKAPNPKHGVRKVIIIDDFYEDPDAVRAQVLRMDFNVT